MFEREDPDAYPCEGCHYYKKQYLETVLNIDGKEERVVVWIPSCRYYLRSAREEVDYLTLFMATGRCRKFKREEKPENKG